MNAKACPRCGSVANLVHVFLPASGRDKGEMKCYWCGWLGHESELTEMPYEVREPKAEKKPRDEDSFLFDV